MSVMNEERRPDAAYAPSPAERDDFWAIGHDMAPTPEAKPVIDFDSTAPFLPDDVRALGRTYNQIDYAVRQNQDPSAQFNMYARMNDIRRMAEVAKNHSALSPEELEAVARQIDMPPNLVAMMQDQYPDELERRKLHAQMLEVAGPDSYYGVRFSSDTKYQAQMRGHEMTFADIQAAVNNVYASSPEIVLGWGKGAAENLFAESVYGIPAGLSQAARDIRNRPWSQEEKIPIPEGLEQSDPFGALQLQEMNYQIQQGNAMRDALKNDVGAQAQIARNEKILSGIDDWLQDAYQDQKASAYAGDTRTGNWWLDNAARPIIEGVPSLAVSAAEAAVLGPLAPLIHFGLQAQTGSYRDMRAEGVDPLTALGVSAARGAVEGYVEKLSIENIFNGPGIRELFRNVAWPSTTLLSRALRVGGHALKSGIGEGVEEVIQGVADATDVPLARAVSLGDPYSNVFSDIYEGRGDLLRQGWGGFALGVLSGGLLGNSRRELSDMRRYNAFQKAASPLVAAGDAAIKNGKGVAETRQEIRAMAHEAVANGSGMGTTVYADPGDVESYLQGKPREAAEKTLAAIGVTPEAYRQAQTDQTDIEIPIENLAVQEGGSDPELVKIFRPTPNMATAAATGKRMWEAVDIFDTAREFRKTMDADVEGTVIPEPIRVLREDLRNNLQYKAQEADFVASMVWAYAKTQAERRSLDLNQFLTESVVGNIRAAMDGWIRRNPAWLAGVRDNQANVLPVFAEEDMAIAEALPEIVEETANVVNDAASTLFDPAMGEGAMDVPEQPGDGDAGIPAAEPDAAARPVDTGSGDAGGSDVQSPAPEPERTLFSPPPRSVQPGEYADTLTSLPFTMETVSTAGIKTDPGAFQFKRDADAETGVKKGQELPGDVNPAALGTMVLYEDVDGDRFVVSGHHRLDLLRRKGEEAEVRAVILREGDGWTTDKARVYGAALNIQEGGGDTDDYATFFRETRGSLDRDTAEKEGLLRRKNARTGYSIGALGSDRVFYDFLNGELSAAKAAAIAAAAPGDPAIQDMMIERKIPTADLATFAGYVRKMQNSGVLNLDGVQLSLFAGKDHSAMLAAMERESKAASSEAAALDKKAASLEGLLKVGKTLSTAELRKHGARAGDREGLRLEAEGLRAEAERWRNFFHHPDILAQVQERAGTAVKPETYAQEEHNSDTQATVKAIATYGDFFDEAMQDRTTNQPYRDMLPVSKRAADMIKERLGLTVSGSHGVEGSTLRHADNYHGVGNEKWKGQGEIDKDSFSLVPLIVNAPDNIYDGGEIVYRERNTGIEKHMKRILFEKKIGDTYYVVEEVRKKGKRLAFVSVWKKIGKESIPRPTSETPPVMEDWMPNAPDSLHNDTIPHADGIVNPDETFNQAKRGEVELYRADATHRQAAVIRAMRNSDKSIMFHELGHIFLADMRDYVNTGGADIDTVRDYGILLRAAGDLSKSDANTDNVEQVARWFEEYFREGRAPSVELIKPFGLFSKWLINIYSNIREYVGAEMDAETRGVFDRWLASEREIAEAESYYGGLHSANFLNLIDDEEERKRLDEKLQRNRQRIRNRHAAEMAKTWTSANADRRVLEREVREEVWKEPVYRAIEEANFYGIDRAAAEKTVGKATILKIIDAHGDIFTKELKPVDVEATLRKVGYHEKDPLAMFLNELARAVPVAEAVRMQGSHGRRKRYYEALEIIAKAGGIDPDMVPFIDPNPRTMEGLEKHRGLFRFDGRENLDRIAMEAGFKTPSDMLAAMAKAPSTDTLVNRLTNRKVSAKAKEGRAWAEETIQGVMDDNTPGGQSALHNPDEDIQADSIELQRKAFQKALDKREGRREAYVSRRAMEDSARQTLYAKTLREAMDYNNYAKTERYWSTVAAEAMVKGDREGALAALDKQQKFHVLSTEAFRIRRDYTDFIRRYGIRVAQSELKTVESAYRDAIRDILTWSGVVVDRSGRFTPENADPDRLILPVSVRDEYDANADGDPDAVLDSFHPELEALIPEWIRLKKLPRGFIGNILELTPAMMQDIDASIRTLMDYGRGELKAMGDAENRRVDELRDSVMAVMDTLPRRKKLRPDKKALDAKRSFAQDFLAGNMSIDVMAEEVDDFALHTGKEMGLMMRMVGKIREGEVKQAEYLDAFKTNTQEYLRILDAFTNRLKKENGGTFFNPDGVRSPAELTDGESADTEWDPDMILSVMFNAGNPGNLYALQQGFGLTDAELNTLFSLATEKEWLAVQHVAREIESLFPLMDAVHYRLTNRHLEKVQTEKITVMTAEGKELEMDGWYYPLAYDPNLNDRAGRNAEASEYRAVMSAIFNPQNLKDGFTKARVLDEEGKPVVAYPPLLKTSVIMNHLTAATRWITMAEPLIDFRRVTMDPKFRKLFIDKLGKERYRDLRMWTNRMARPDKGIDEGINRLIRKFRNASTVSALGLNLRSAVRQLSSVGLAADAMSKASGTGKTGWYFMWRGLRRMGARGAMSRLSSPLGFRSEATEEMFRLSPEAKYRAGNVNKEIRDALDGFRPASGRIARKWAQAKEALFHFTISADHIVSGAAFWGAYDQALSGNAGFEVTLGADGKPDAETERKAVEYANYIVRTQQSPYQADYTRLQADNGPISLLTQFMGGLTPYLNNAYINVKIARKMGWKGAYPLATHLLNAYILPSVALRLIGDEVWAMLAGEDDDGEENKLAWDLTEDMVGQLTGGLPVVRDGARWVVKSARTGRRQDIMSLPALQFINRTGGKIYSSISNFSDGDAYAAGKDVGMAAAEIFGVGAPIRQLEPVAVNMGLMEGEE